MASKQVLFLVTNHQDLGSSGLQVLGWYLPELCHPFDEYEKAGFKVDFASPSGGLAPVDKSSVTNFATDEVCSRVWSRRDVMEALENTKRLSDLNFDDYDAIFVVGGHAPMWDLTNNKDCCDKLGAFAKRGGLIGAVCHGPCALLNVFVDGECLVKGKEVTCFTNVEEDQVPGHIKNFLPYLLEDRLKERGARFVNSPPWQACVAGKGTKLLTGQNPASAGPLASTMIDVLRSRSSKAAFTSAATVQSQTVRT